jgi:hypothetical protein
MNASRMQNAGNSHASSIKSNTRTVQQSTRTISADKESSNVVRREMRLGGPISYLERSGRAIRLLTRFR